MTGVNRYIGASIERVEDLRFLHGRGEYVADLVRDRLLYAGVLRSPVAHGRIRAITGAANMWRISQSLLVRLRGIRGPVIATA